MPGAPQKWGPACRRPPSLLCFCSIDCYFKLADLYAAKTNSAMCEALGGLGPDAAGDEEAIGAIGPLAEAPEDPSDA